jgi:hypothetical protein
MPHERVGWVRDFPVLRGHRADVYLAAKAALGFARDVVKLIFVRGTDN